MSMKKKPYVLVVLFILSSISTFANAENLSIEFWYVQHRIFEDGNNYNTVSFGIIDTDTSEYVSENIVVSVKLYEPDGSEVQLGTPIFWASKSISGGYDSENDQWGYSETFRNESGFYCRFDAALKAGNYHLIVTDTNSNTYDAYKEYNQSVDLPIISSESFYAYEDDFGNLIWKWDVPDNVPSNLSTSIRAWIDVYNNDLPVADLYVKVPTHMGNLFVPKITFEKIIAEGNIYNIGLHIRTNDNNNRSYSNEIYLNQANVPPCDVDGDGKTGLQEAIHALKVTAGTNNR